MAIFVSEFSVDDSQVPGIIGTNVLAGVSSLKKKSQTVFITSELF